jgi:citrate lyase subunit beta/citryl-CoA lyase
MVALPRSWLYVPGDRPERFPKAVASGADQVVIDLEDSVTLPRKGYARDAAVDWLARSERPVTVRINDIRTPEGRRDLDALLADPQAAAHLRGIRVPKVETGDQARQVSDAVDEARCAGEVYPLVESALGVIRIPEISSAHPRVRMVCLGAGDLAADLGVGVAADAMTWAEGRLVYYSRALGLLPPAMSVFPHVTDTESLRADCARGRAQGFHGRSAVHPVQVSVINHAFTPAPGEVAAAREIINALSGQGGAVTTTGGCVVDAATAKYAERVIALATDYSHGSG